MSVDLAGADGKHSDRSKGTTATGGGKNRPGDRAESNVSINNRVPPGVLNDAALQALGHNHGQTDFSLEANHTARIYGGLESLDGDGTGAGSIPGDSDEANIHTGND